MGVVLFTLARFAIAYGTLDRYGLNVWVFGFVDIVTAVPYGLSTARLAGAIVDRDLHATARWGAVACFCFLAPYLYIAVAGRDVGMPAMVYVVLAVLLVCFGASAVHSVARRVRAGAPANLT